MGLTCGGLAASVRRSADWLRSPFVTWNFVLAAVLWVVVAAVAVANRGRLHAATAAGAE